MIPDSVWKMLFGFDLGDGIRFKEPSDLFDQEYFGYIIKFYTTKTVLVGVLKVQHQGRMRKSKSLYYVPIKNIRAWENCPKTPRIVKEAISLATGKEID